MRGLKITGHSNFCARYYFMTTNVFLIAVSHAVPVFVGALISGYSGALVAAVLMTFIAFIVGSLQYVIFDILAVWIAYFICSKALD